MSKTYDKHPHYHFLEGDAKDVGLLKELIADCDQFIALAAIVGGISLFHETAYLLFAENMRITASAFDAAIWAHQHKKLQRIIVISSSMVFENTNTYPTPEGEQLRCPPPQSTYGFQKLSCEYFAKGAHEQHGLPYTTIRLFNVIGIGEKKALLGTAVTSGHMKLSMSHVVPDFILKILQGQDPLHILGDGNQVRCYTYGGDVSRGIRLAMESDEAINDDFNISCPTPTTVIELAQLIWNKIYPAKPFRYITDAPYKYDVRKRIPDTSKARNILGFEATTTLSESLDEIIPWIKQQIYLGGA
jgi:nucleoside-diphosphate-sugar epimerase